MVFSGLLGSSNTDRGAASRPKLSAAPSSSSSILSSRDAAAPAGPEYLFDESQLRPAGPEPPDLRDLNHSLEALAAVFPDIQIEVFREMLASFDGESRLAVVADALLKSRASWVKGRWKVADKEDAAGGSGGGGPSPSSSSSSSPPPPPPRRLDANASSSGNTAVVPGLEVFRSPEYKKAVRNLALYEFKGLSKSAINAVLAENNYSYLEARRTLVILSSKSWRFTLSSLFLRRKPPVACGGEATENHPLVVWKSSGQGSILPCLRSTGDAELDRELFLELVAPIKARGRARQEDEDRALAAQLNAEEAEAAGATYECACCFTTATFEELTTCNGAEGHVVCFRCVQHSISEAVFGQGWHRSIDKDRGTLRCPAVDADECPGCIPADHAHRAMLHEKKGAEILHRLERRLAEHSLLASNVPLVRCPFCDYAEVDDIYVAPHEARLRIRTDSLYGLLFAVLAAAIVAPFLVLPALAAACLTIIIVGNITPRHHHHHHHGSGSGVAAAAPSDYVRAEFAAALSRFRRRRRGAKFTCQSPRCGRVSCLSCGKAWVDIHVCHESALVALRTQVEQAMSMAIKRVCPRCNTSFVKTAGCNKLTCPCGYKMCYVCRRDIGAADGDDAGYRHFCDHFRPEGDPRPCDQCSRCNLWESEDTDAVLRAAKEEAEARWRETERRDLTAPERAYLETGFSSSSSSSTAATDSRSSYRFGSDLAGSGGGGGSAISAATGLGSSLFRNGRIPTVAELFDLFVETVFA